MNIAFGWNSELEYIHFNAVDAFAPQALCATPSQVPLSFDFAWQQRNQRQRPFCHAHMRGGMEEVLCLLDTKQSVQFSRYYDAITDMRMDGDDSKPEGATIGGSLRAAIADGACMDCLKPYLSDTDVYSNAISESCVADSKHHHIKSITARIRSYDQWKSLAVTGRYVLGLGLDWTEGLANLEGKTTCDGMNLGGRVLGGHAVMSTPRWITVRGDLWFSLDNSHQSWGNGMRCFMSPQWWDRTLRYSKHGAWASSSIAVDELAPLPLDLSFYEPSINL